MKVSSRGWVAAPIERVFAFYDDPANLARLTPPPMRIDLVRTEPSPPRAGSEFEFSYGIGPFRGRWIVCLVDRVENERFEDVTLSGPIAEFHHTHTFRAARRGGTWVEDEIDYHIGPNGPVGVAVDFIAGLAMRAAFIYRHAAQRRLLR